MDFLKFPERMGKWGASGKKPGKAHTFPPGLGAYFLCGKKPGRALQNLAAGVIIITYKEERARKT